MRNWLFILIITALCLFPCAVTALAEDAVLGTVESLDLDKGEIILKVTESSSDTGQEKGQITVHFDPENAPCCLSIGKTVRVWGSYAKGSSVIFQAVAVRGNSSQGHGHDPTGVRSRLGRGKGQGRGGSGHR